MALAGATRFPRSATSIGSMPEWTLLLPDPEATEALGEELGRLLAPGDQLALVGELGSGKTTLVRGLARGLRLEDPEAVQSPTYLLVVEHPGPRPLLHMDAYLGDKLQRFLADGGLDYLAQRDAVVAVEWADRIRPWIAADALWITLGPEPGGGRRVVLRGTESRYPWLPALMARWGGD